LAEPVTIIETFSGVVMSSAPSPRARRASSRDDAQVRGHVV
jgi:hypothetical protein